MARSSGKNKGKAMVQLHLPPQQAPPPPKDPPKHGEEGYDPLKDRNNIGFQLGRYGGASTWLADKLDKPAREDIDAYDFFADPETGKRPGETNDPAGGVHDNLEEDGVDEYTTLPPISIWREGDYLTSMMEDEEFMKPGPHGFDALPFNTKKKVEDLPKEVIDELKDGIPSHEIPPSLFNIYIVSGEGTPGNNVWRAYYLPKEIAADLEPKHPLMWKKDQKKGTRTKPWNLSSSGFGRPSTPVSTPQKPVEPPKPLIPPSVRIRCTGCGHWFKMDSLSDHGKICPATGDGDWAMMCDSACGCETLDQVSQCKPGFPRPKQEQPKAAESPNGDGGSEVQPLVLPV